MQTGKHLNCSLSKKVNVDSVMDEEDSKYNICASKKEVAYSFLKNPFVRNFKKQKARKRGSHSGMHALDERNFKKIKIEEIVRNEDEYTSNGLTGKHLLKAEVDIDTKGSKKQVLHPTIKNGSNIRNMHCINGHTSTLSKKAIGHNTKMLTSCDRQSIIKQRQNLPIHSSREEIMSELRKYGTTIIIGETGSGKTTQIPQFLHEDQLDKERVICVTQPRRVAAITVAKRVAEEMNCEVGDIVGYSVRFEECYSKRTKLKYVTDGMLLREALSDHLLTKYKWIILDEAHERSINTDILFGVVKTAQRKRKLKKKLPLCIIVMSATMDVDHFSTYFNDAPVFYIEGRQHPIEVFASKKHHSDYTLACLSTMLKIHKESRPEEDILIFLTGQEEIDSAVKVIKYMAKDSSLAAYPKLKAFPLYAALPYHKQLKVFTPSLPGERKVIVSTNIAETSVTIPGIKYVIDCGHVKIRTFNSASGFDDLKVCKISQAQAWQRMGRAGREGPGSCYRTYTDEEFVAMSVNTVPEILRANLASVLLKLLAIGIKNVVNYDFIDKPPKESLQQAEVDLRDLKAVKFVEGIPILTELGKKMSVFPLEPQYAKLLINGPNYSCTSEILTIIAILSSESAFVNPSEKKEDAQKRREKFTAIEGDHITLLNIYKAFSQTTNKKIWCRKNFLNFRNLSYAGEVRRQLEELCQKNKVPLVSCNGASEPVIKCLISALYKNVSEVTFGAKYKVLRTAEFAKIHPLSTLFGRSPDYILFTELIKTGKTYMHLNSEVKAEWLMEFDADYFRSRHMRKMSL